MNTTKKRKAALVVCLSALVLFSVPAEESFGFDDDHATDASPGATIDGAAIAGVSIGGEVSASATAFAENLESTGSLGETSLGDIFSGKLNVSAKGSNADAVVDFVVAPALPGVSPVSLDEAYARAYWGKLDLEAGLRKLVWGKADSSGPLDVMNPLDYTDLTVTDSLERKIARPMLHASYSLGSFTKLEGVFEPQFAGHSFAVEGLWTPSAVTGLKERISAEATASLASLVAAGQLTGAQAAANGAYLASALEHFDAAALYPETSTLEYAQYGLRFTTTVRSSDIGIQYVYGNLPRPAISVDTAKLVTSASASSAVSVAYNRYHQIGVDYASVLGKFNVRSELAANITEDFGGDDGAVYNPAVLWSVGFDRDLLAGVNLNAQAAGSVRLMDDGIGDTVADAEANTDMTKTTVTAKLSRKFLKDELELAATALVGIEASDCLVMPSLVWAKGETRVELSCGIFAGDSDGELGQYDGNDYVKLALTYAF